MGALQQLWNFGAAKQFSLSDLGVKLLADFKDSTNPANIVSSGGLVSQWAEAGGKHAVETTYKPTITSDGIQFNSANTTDILTSPLARNSSDITIFIVIRFDGIINNGRFIGTSSNVLNMQQLTGNAAQVYITQNTSTSLFNPLLSGFHILTVEKKASTIQVFIDGNDWGEIITNTGTFNFTSFTFGNRPDRNSGSKVTIKRCVVTSGNLTNTERYNVINKLNKDHSVFSGISINNATTKLYSPYRVATHTVVPNQEPLGTNQANTGLAYDPILNEIYVVETPRNYIKVYDADFNYLREFSAEAGQGIAKDYINNLIYSFATANQLKKISPTGTTISTQSFWNVSAGSITIDTSESNLVIWATYGGEGTDVQKWVFNQGSGLFEYSLTLQPAGGVSEGIAWDSRDNTLWIRQANCNYLTHLNKDGTIIQRFQLIEGNNGEGLAVNASRNLIYSNHDRFYHGGIDGGNKCMELYPDFLK